MSNPKTPPPAKLIASIIFQGEAPGRETATMQKVLHALSKEIGTIDYQSSIMPFTHTAYYNREMGDFLLRTFISFKELVQRDLLVDIKLLANGVEKKFTDAYGKRMVNIDPGLLSPENLILATGKNFTHRIYLHRGIFAEVTLIYQNKQFTTLPWTYPDYSSAEVTAILTGIRNQLLVDLQNLES